MVIVSCVILCRAIKKEEQDDKTSWINSTAAEPLSDPGEIRIIPESDLKDYMACI